MQGHPRDKGSGSEAPTSEQIRAGIDSGRTRDKVAASDPAAVPLGADDEAAGFPPSPEERRAAQRQERQGPAAGEGNRKVQEEGETRTRMASGYPIFLLPAIAIVLIIAAYLLL